MTKVYLPSSIASLTSLNGITAAGRNNGGKSASRICLEAAE